jgi:hypothetical protein
MQLDITQRQCELLLAAVERQIAEIDPDDAAQQARPALGTEPDDLQAFRALRDHLQQANRAAQTSAAWEGYAESREIPSNPPPGR